MQESSGIRFRVREVSEAKGLDIEGLRRATGLPLSTIKELWNQPTKDQYVQTLVAVVLALDVKLSDLVVLTPEAKDKEV